MKFLLIILLLISGYASAQTTYYIRADSTKLQKVGGNNELILQNSTRTRTGAYLKNISNGITGFFYAIDSAWMATDSTLVVRRGDGNDTLLIRGSGISTTPGIDDVLAVGQSLTANRLIDLDGNDLTMEMTTGDDTRFKILFGEVLGYTESVGSGTTSAFRTNQDLTEIYTTRGGDFATSISRWDGISRLEAAMLIHPANSINYGVNVENLTKGILIGRATTVNQNNFRGIRIDSLWQVYLDSLTNLSTQDQLIGILNSSGQLGQVTIGTGLSLSSGQLTATGAASTVPISGLTASAATNGLTIGHAQTWTSSLTTATPLILTTSTLTSGNILNLTSTTVDINTGVGLNINFSGANANAGRTAKGLAVAVTNTGTTNTNTGATFDVSGAVVNTALFGTASGGTTSRGSWFTASGASSSNHAVLGAASGADARGFFASISGTGATTYGAYLDNQTAGTTAFGMFTSVTGANTTNIGVRITASGATTNNALDIAAGALTLNGSAGTSGQVLTSAGANTLPTWETPSAGGAAPGNFGNVIINRNNVDATPGSDSLDFDGGLVVKGSGTFSTLTSGSVVYAGTGGLLTTSSNLTYSGTAFTTIGNHTGNQTFFVKNTNADGRAAFQMGTDANDLNGFFFANGSTKTDYAGAGSINFMNILNAPLGFITNNTLRATITGPGNLMLGGFTDPASAVYAFGITNGVAPSGSITNGVVLYSEDVAASAELKVRDEAGNITVLSPHHFEGIPMGKSEDMAWSYYSERDGKYITVDMLKAIRTIEDLTRRVEKLEKELNMKSKKPVKLVYTGKVKAKKPVPINKQP